MKDHNFQSGVDPSIFRKQCLKFIKTLELSLLILLVFFPVSEINAQDCSINAGISENVCDNNLSYTLSGSTTGLNLGQPVWSQIAGPSVIIDEPTNLNTPISGMVGGNSYTFRLTTTCNNGSIQFQDVVITARTITKAITSDDIESCPDKSGSIMIHGNTPIHPGEIGTWSFVGSNSAGVIIDSPNSASTSISLLESYAGTSILRWTIRGEENAVGQACESFSDIIITNYGGKAIVNAGDDQFLNHCYTVSQSTSLNANFAGNNTNGQVGTWSLVSGPSTPKIEDLNNGNSKISDLIEGTYILLWSVSGPCVTGTDTVAITIAPATQEVSNAVIQYSNIKFCDASINTATLVGSVPEFTGETVEWVQTSGPVASILNANSSTTQITNLDGKSTYKFVYTIANMVTSCSNSKTVTIQYSIEPISITVNNGNDIMANCGVTKVDIPFVDSGIANNSYSIISGPDKSKIVDSGAFENLTSSPLALNFDVEGTYTLLFRRAVTGSVLTGCDEVTDVINVTISSIPTPANAGTGQTLSCNVTETSLIGNVVTVGNSLWSQIDGPSTASITAPYERTTGVTDLVSGVYTFRYSISGGGQCNPPAFSDVVITVPSSVTITSDAGLDQNVCFGSPVQLNGNDPPASNLVGAWSVALVPFGVTIVFDDVNNPNTIVTGLIEPSETYSFKWTIANPDNPICPYPSEDTVKIVTNSTAGPKEANAGTDQCLPSGTTMIVLAGNEPAADETGTWSAIPIAGISFTNVNQYNTTATITKEQSYVLTWTLDRCQASSDEVEITVGDAVAFAGEDADVCANTYKMQATSSTGEGLWTLVSGLGGYTIDDETSPITEINFTFSGQYIFEWTVQNGNCSVDTDQIVLNIGIPPTIATVGADQSICNDTSVILSGNTFDANVETGVWTLLTGAPNTPNVANVNDPNTTVTNLVSGSYIFRWTISGDTNCPLTYADIKVDVFTPANAGIDQLLCESTNLVLEATFGSTGTWMQIDGPGVNGNSGVKAGVVQNPINSNLAQVTIIPGNSYVFEFTTDYISCVNTSDQVKVISSSGSTSTPNAGSDQVLCNSSTNTSIILDGNEPISAGFDTGIIGNSAFWRFASTPEGSVATINNITQHNSTLDDLIIPGIYILEWNFSTENCTEESDVVRIEVFEPSIADAGMDQTNACQLKARLKATTPETGIGEWSITTDPSNGDIVVDSPNSATSIISNITTLGTYVFTWTVRNGNFVTGDCAPSIDTVAITFTNNTPDIAEAGPNQEFCNITQITMDATPLSVGTGTWSQTAGPGVTQEGKDANIISINDPKTLIQNLEPGIYEFTWTSVSGGCSFIDTTEVVIYENPSSAKAGQDQILNEFSVLTLDAEPVTIGMGSWTQISGPSVVNFIDDTNPNTSVLGTTVGDYVFEWTGSNGICSVSSDVVGITFFGSADLELSFGVLPEIANEGDVATFTISIFNNDANGSADATGLSIRDIIPDGYNILTESISNEGIYSSGNNLIVWSDLNVINGETLELTFQAIVKGIGSYITTAEIITSDQPDRDSLAGNHLEAEDDQDSTRIILEQVDLELFKEVSKTSVNVGDVVTFTITVFNNPEIEDGDATGVTILDRFPRGYTLITESLDNGGIYNAENSTIEWSNLSIPNGNISKVTYNAIVNATGSYINTAEIKEVDQKDPDSYPNNEDGDQSEDDETSIFVVPVTTDLVVEKSVNNFTPALEENIVFTIKLTNNGDSEATNIGIDELIPSGYLFIDAEVTRGNYDNIAGFWSIPALESFGVAILRITVEVLKTGDYLNIATLAFLDQIDLNISNDSAEATIEPSCIKVYNQFSPNNDSVNDFFKIDCLSGYPNNSLKIYDRWGVIVFEQKGYTNDWKGISNGNTIVKAGEKLPVGTYFYILDLGNGSTPRVDWLYLNL